MKYNFFFVHGWAFDSKFWVMVGELIKKKEYFNSIEYINLGFIDKKNLKKTQPENCVYIVHSYGLNWFLKKKIKCKILITFFAAPDFTKFQKNSVIKKKQLKLMIEKFSSSPDKVISNFYKNSGLNNKLKNNLKQTNYRELLRALDALLNDNLQKEFNSLDCKVFSVYSLKDKIFQPSLVSIKKLKCKKHTIKILMTNSHAMPIIKPKKTFDLIDSFICSLKK